MAILPAPMKPRWLRDLLRFLPLKSQFVLSGSVRDLQAHETTPGSASAVPLSMVLTNELAAAGYERILAYDPIAGLRVAQATGAPATHDALLQELGLQSANGAAPAGTDLLGTVLERVVLGVGPATAVIVDFASRLIMRSDVLAAAEHQLFTRALVLTQRASARPVGRNRSPLFNSILWLVDKEGDLPDWLIIDNPRLRHIPVAKPDRLARRAVAASLIRSLPGAREASSEVLGRAEQDLVDETEGLLLMDLNAIVGLGRAEGLNVTAVADAVRRYKVGVTDDEWRKIERSKIASAEDFVARRVIGQTHAVTHMLDIIKRAATGISGARRGGRPRGVAFLAGPTGVGKTELAKTVTELLFGDETAYIRFDMSEFSAEHADQRLLGAPPGYVGYDVGGELTNAIREKPFSVVLFDEIEKAHPRILDKFLQILDDGVLTSGRGDRVYFSEALIVFTSNLGIYSTDSSGARLPNVTAAQPYDEVRSKVRSEIDSHFKVVLNRPEILNRIGENIIVFDFIRPDVAVRIFEQMVVSILSNVKEAGYDISLAAAARTQLQSLCLADLSNGGRGIRNQLEAHLTNPLARALFEHERGAARFEISKVVVGVTTSLVLGPAA
ncbi:AAA family ATPase [Steroidobacter sp.]|uniref:AAA family ATPase n=1 Tax=Steroidobacter sp. TaxID=1978227 RepID=UPI001A51E58C|nr:AAA family ATPase [Steroidobacter sp.]MBL8271680.1 ATP-dependent Clp protease ATP-binding subunit [Steroidobacter sp.]